MSVLHCLDCLNCMCARVCLCVYVFVSVCVCVYTCCVGVSQHHVGMCAQLFSNPVGRLLDLPTIAARLRGCVGWLLGS